MTFRKDKIYAELTFLKVNTAQFWPLFKKRLPTDDIEHTIFKKISLWAFGFLY